METGRKGFLRFSGARAGRGAFPPVSIFGRCGVNL